MSLVEKIKEALKTEAKDCRRRAGQAALKFIESGDEKDRIKAKELAAEATGLDTAIEIVGAKDFVHVIDTANAKAASPQGE